ncbi:MAG: antisense-enhancing sequence [Linnemannia gamsii]|nr:MAG: antisense-enhancing sequence [Linnemannia gamsii]
MAISPSTTFPFYQIDVFTSKGFLGNPLAVIVALDTTLPVPSNDQMQQIASWTNLSETTFLLPPTDPSKADYRVRIFTPNCELPFAGHPTIGTCRGFLEYTRSEKKTIVQECEAGLIELKVSESDGSIAFVAPPLRKTGPVEEETVKAVCESMGIAREDVLDTQWVVNGPHWFALLLKDAETVLKASRIPTVESKKFEFGIVGKYPSTAASGAGQNDKKDGDSPFFEIRAFPHVDLIDEDPVCGSFNAGVAQWLIGNGVAPPSYVASQGLALGRRGRIVIHRDDSDLSVQESKRAVWVGGQTVICIKGTIQV